MEWDEYFLNICQAVSLKSHCHSRQLGAILVIDKRIISTGYNGPPAGVPECRDRMKRDPEIIKMLKEKQVKDIEIDKAYEHKICPRRILKFPSGEGLEWCNSIHAEKNCLIAAARMGVQTKGATLYFNGEISPCTQCLGACINAGIKEIVLLKNNNYDATVAWVNGYSKIKIREFCIDK